MRFAFVDLQIPGKKANRDHTGGFGSQMGSEGFAGGLVGRLKSKLIDLPVLSFGFGISILRERGHEARYYRASTQGEEVILIASSLHCHREEIAFAQEERRRFPRSKIGFFGPFVKTNPEVFESSADFLIFSGELESTLLAYVDEGFEFRGRMDHGIVADMNRLPAPDWRGVDVGRFSYFPLLHKRPMLTTQTSRGCSFDCDFCPYMVSQTKKFRRRSPENVIAELLLQKERHGIRSVLFRDIVFSIHREHTVALCKLMIEKKLDLEWACETRVDCLDDELIDLMVAAGCRGMNLGIETGDTTILEKSGKKPPVLAEQEATIRYLHRKGIRVSAFYMLGLIGDTPQTMESTIRYARTLNTVGAQFCTMTPFPGTALFENLKGDLLTRDFSRFNEYQPVVDIKTSTPEQIVAAASKAYRYYLRPRWLLPYAIPTSVRLLRNLAAI